VIAHLISALCWHAGRLRPNKFTVCNTGRSVSAIEMLLAEMSFVHTPNITHQRWYSLKACRANKSCVIYRYFIKSGPEKQKVLSTFLLYLRYYIPFLGLCKLFLFNSSSNCTWIQPYKYLYLKSLKFSGKWCVISDMNKLDLYSSVSQVQK
jgi:hypothetical protein